MKARRAFLIGPMLFESVTGGTFCTRGAAKAALRKAFSGLESAPGKLKGDMLIAVDGGLEFCVRAGIKVDLAVGDWDSLSGRIYLRDVPHITLPRDKDRSDTYFALGAALIAGGSSVYLAGFSGGRPDHELATFFDAAAIAVESPDRTLEINFVSERADCAIVTSKRTFNVARGQVVSVFAIGGAARGVSLTGFRYPLKRAVLEPSSRGLSNVVETRKIEVKVGSGTLLVIMPRIPRRVFDKRGKALA